MLKIKYINGKYQINQLADLYLIPEPSTDQW